MPVARASAVAPAAALLALSTAIIFAAPTSSATLESQPAPEASTAAAKNGLRVLGGVEIASGARTDLSLAVPSGSTDPATEIPVSVLRGSRPGPVLLVVAGVHGFEFVSILAAARLAEEIEPETLAGTLILVRAALLSAFEQRTPYVNPFDRKNLNRSFPGNPAGSQTERIAHVLSTELIARADFVVDAHSGDGAEWLAPFLGVYGGPLASDYDTALRFAEAVGLPTIVRYSMDSQEQIDRGRSLNRQAVAQGVPTVLVEIGENGQRRSDHVQRVVDGLRAGMVALAMLPAREESAGPRPEPRYFHGTASVPVHHSGIWYPADTRGRDITRGELLGEIRDHRGQVVEQVRAPVSGFALYGLAGPPVREGDSVLSIALPPE